MTAIIPSPIGLDTALLQVLPYLSRFLRQPLRTTYTLIRLSFMFADQVLRDSDENNKIRIIQSNTMTGNAKSTEPNEQLTNARHVDGAQEQDLLAGW
jgi:hypothetical protein